MRRLMRIGVALLLALAMLGAAPEVAHADAAADCTAAANNNPFGWSMPWNFSCYGGVVENSSAFVVNSAVGGVADWVTHSAGEATTMFLTGFVSTTTRPELGATWFEHIYYGGAPNSVSSSPYGAPGALMLAMLLAVPLFSAAVLMGIVHGDIGALIKLVTVRLPIAVLAAFAFPFVVARLLDLTDIMSSWVMQGGTEALTAWASKLNPVDLGQDFVVVVVCLVIIFATLLAYIELFVRDAALYIVIAFVPLIAIATLWPGARHALKRAIETVFVLCVSKFVMAFVLILGAGLITSHSANTFYPLIAGAIIFLLAGTAPLTIFRLIPLMEGAAAGAVAGAGAQWAQRHGSRLMHRSHRGSGSQSSGGAAPAGAAGGMGTVVALRPSGSKGGEGQIRLVGQKVEPASVETGASSPRRAEAVGSPSGAPTPRPEAPDGSKSTPSSSPPIKTTPREE